MSHRDITRPSDLKELKGLGEGLKRRVIEILNTGTLSELTSNPDLKGMNELRDIHGIGPKTLCELYRHGTKNVASLKQLLSKDATGTIKIPAVTRIALQYNTHERIPRSLIQDVHRYLKDKIPVKFEICGSYRRDLESSGDIDVLIKKGDALWSLNALILSLEIDGFLVARLSLGTNVYHGICKFRNRYCRIDFLLTDEEDYAAALLHYTGSGSFNQIVRHHADRQGYKLSNLGLFQRATGEKISLDSEKAIFDRLNICYMKPCERNL